MDEWVDPGEPQPWGTDPKKLIRKHLNLLIRTGFITKAEARDALDLPPAEPEPEPEPEPPAPSGPDPRWALIVPPSEGIPPWTPPVIPERPEPLPPAVKLNGHELGKLIARVALWPVSGHGHAEIGHEWAHHAGHLLERRERRH